MDVDNVMKINPQCVEFFPRANHYSWCDSKTLNCFKESIVHAQKLIESDHWKVVFPHHKKTTIVKNDDFQSSFCAHPTLESNWYYENRVIARALKLISPIQIKNTLGNHEYGDIGDYLVYLHQNDIKIVNQAIFTKIYKIII